MTRLEKALGEPLEKIKQDLRNKSLNLESTGSGTELLKNS